MKKPRHAKGYEEAGANTYDYEKSLVRYIP